MMWQLGVIFEDHPLIEPEKDHYVVFANAVREPIHLEMEVDDKTIAKLIEKDPANERRLGLSPSSGHSRGL